MVGDTRCDTLLLQIDKKGNKGKQLASLSEVLEAIKPTEFKDQSLISYKVRRREHALHTALTQSWVECASPENKPGCALLLLFFRQTDHWSTLIANKDGDVDGTPALSGTETKRREAVWEVFQAECVFLIDHLMVLKHVRHSSLVSRT